MITVSTLLYQGNYSRIISRDSWFTKYNPNYDHKKLIIVNNVDDRNYMQSILDEYKNLFGIDYFFVEDYEKSCLEIFNLDINKEKTLGYFYIIPYLAFVLKLDTEYVFLVSEDCTSTIKFSEKFVIDSIKEIETNHLVFSTTLSWGMKGSSMGYDVGEWEQISTFGYKNKVENKNEKFWYTVGFSDQVFITSKKNLMKADYNLDPSFVSENGSPICQGTPYCPESWERRVSEYIHNNNMYRAVWKNNEEYYLHEK